MKLIVGLGNYPEQYHNTRHNVGFMLIDYVCETNNFKLDKEKFKGVYTLLSVNDHQVIFAKPYTYMNLSGDFVRDLCQFYKIKKEDILVLYDDVETDLGKVRVRMSGSSGGQKGIQDIINKLGTQDIKRIRIGVGKKRFPTQNLADYVLSQFTKEERLILNKNFASISELVFDFIEEKDFNKIITDGSKI